MATRWPSIWAARSFRSLRSLLKGLSQNGDLGGKVVSFAAELLKGLSQNGDLSGEIVALINKPSNWGDA